MTTRARSLPGALLLGGSLLAMVVGIPAGCTDDGRLRRAEARVQAGEARLAAGDVEGALVEFEAALALQPGDLSIHVRVGAGFAAAGRPDQASREFRYVLGRDPRFADAYEAWGDALADRGRNRKAVRLWRTAARLTPRPRVLTKLGVGLVEIGDDRSALATFKRADALAPTLTADALAHRGVALEHLGSSGEARQRYEAALRSAPRNRTALVHLGRLLVADPAEQARGIALLEEMFAMDPADPAGLDALGWAYVQRGRYAEGYDLIQRSLAATDADAPAFHERRDELRAVAAKLPRLPPAPDAPNVLLVVVDTLRADHVTSYGYGRATTPNIDRLAADGVLFENVVSQAPWTAASVATLLTGLYPSAHGLDGGARWDLDGATLPFAVQKTLHVGQVTLAEVLRRHGYQTVGFVSNVYLNSVFGFAQGFDTYRDDHRDYSSDVLSIKRRGEDTNRGVFEWLERGRREPFFLLVHYNDPHWPYIPPPPFGAEWTAGYRGALTPEDTGVVVESRGRPITDLNAEDVAYLVGLYDGEIAYADANVGALLGKVAAAGLERPLVTVLTADHGEEFLEHGSASHGYTLYDEQIRVPLIVRRPERLRPARVSTQVRIVDVMPTILDLVGIHPADNELQGTSLVPLMDDRTTLGLGDAFSEATLREPKQAIRTDAGLKLIAGPRQTLLFDLTRDPHETHDIRAGEPDAVRALEGRLLRWADANRARRALPTTDGAPHDSVVVDEAMRRRLQALGYVQP